MIDLKEIYNNDDFPRQVYRGWGLVLANNLWYVFDPVGDFEGSFDIFEVARLYIDDKLSAF